MTTTRLGPGRLVLVVGPSGAGKDTLIAGARALLPADDNAVFVRRIVTRAGTAFEDNEAIDPALFAQEIERGAFALHWEAHGLCYALPASLNEAIGQGRTVVANVSRGVIAAARERYADVVAVLVTAPPEVLAARLAGRARASDGPIEARLKRGEARFDESSQPDLVIENVGDPTEGAMRLAAVIGK